MRACDFFVLSQNPMLKTNDLCAKKSRKFKKVTNSEQDDPQAFALIAPPRGNVRDSYGLASIAPNSGNRTVTARTASCAELVFHHAETEPPNQPLATSGAIRVAMRVARHVAHIDKIKARFFADLAGVFQSSQGRRGRIELIGWVVAREVPGNVPPQARCDSVGDRAKRRSRNHSRRE